MPTRNVVLTDPHAHFVETFVTSGRYQNASEVLRMVERRESEADLRFAVLCEAARIGIADLATGAFRSFDSTHRLGQHLATLTSEVFGTK